MLRTFAEWWYREFLSLFNRPSGSAMPGVVDHLQLEMLTGDAGQPPSIRISGRQGAGARGAADITLDRNGIDSLVRMAAAAKQPLRGVLRPPAGAVLCKSLNLPGAAEPELRRVIGYEMDRETPFAADEVYWDAAVLERDRSHGRLHVRLSLVPRALVDGVILPLRSAGLEVVGIEVAEGANRLGLIELPRSEAAMRQARQRLLLRGGAVAAGLVLLVSLPFIIQAVSMARVEGRIADLQPQFADAEAQQDGRPRGPIAQELARTGDALAILAQVTEAIPDHGFLTDFSLKARRLTLIGRSTAATDLLAAVAGHPGLRNAAFAAPVTREPGSNVEMFTITLEATP